jgi:hypothetical protein
VNQLKNHGGRSVPDGVGQPPPELRPSNTPACDGSGSERHSAHAGAAGRIDPVMKSWMDHVIVPAMVRQYVAAVGAAEDNGKDRFPLQDSGTQSEEPIQ